MSDGLEISVNFTTREFSVSGPNESVEKWTERFLDLLDRSPSAHSEVHTEAGGPAAGPATSPAASPVAELSDMPETFGEYLHNFGKDVSHNDHVLIAGHFAQAKSGDNSFATGDVNDLLVEQGIRLPNPSNAVKRNVDARRVFAIGPRRFRVSRNGIEHLWTLRNGESNGNS
jgi:hypothetical protein